MTQVVNVPTFKCALVGDCRVGKTSFARRQLIGDFKKKNEESFGATIYPLAFYTTKGKIIFKLWDISNSLKFGENRDEFLKGAQCAIMMYDVTWSKTYKNIPKWYNHLVRACNSIPMALVGNKVDVFKARKVFPQHVTFHVSRNTDFFEISAKANFNFDKPFLWLARKLVGDPKLELVVMSALYPPNIKMDLKLKAKVDLDMKEAQEAIILEEEEGQEKDDE